MRSARVLGFLLALCAALPANAREFRSSDIYPFDYPTVQAVVQVDKLMRERSGAVRSAMPYPKGRLVSNSITIRGSARRER